MKTTKYPELTPQERKRLYNKQFRERMKNDSAYQEQLAEYRRQKLKESYYKLKEQDPTAFEEYTKKHSDYANKSRKRAVERGDGEKYKRGNRRYYEENKERCLQNSSSRRIFIRTSGPDNYVKYLLEGAKQRAKKQNIEFSIVPSDLHLPNRCLVLDIPLVTTNVKLCDDSPTIDRIDSTKGYVAGNVHIISWRANTLKKNATPEELQKLANFFNQM